MGRRVVDVPEAAEPAVVPAPLAVIPVPAETTNAAAAVGVAVLGSPEEDVAGVARIVFLPALGNELGMREEVVEDIGRKNQLVPEFLLELLATDGLAAHLIRRKTELHLRRIPREHTAYTVRKLILLLDTPAVRDERRSVAVDEVTDHLQLACAAHEVTNFCKNVAFTELLDIIVRPVVPAEGQLEFIRLSDIEHEFAHRRSPCATVFRMNLLLGLSPEDDYVSP